MCVWHIGDLCLQHQGTAVILVPGHVIYSTPQMIKHGIYSVTDGRKLVKLLTGMFIIVSIVYFLFGRKTSHDIKAESHDTNEVCIMYVYTTGSGQLCN